MSVHETSVVTKAVKRANVFVEHVKLRLLKEFQQGIGYEEVSEKETTQLITDAMKGNPTAMVEVENLYATNGAQMDVRINAVLARVLGKI